MGSNSNQRQGNFQPGIPGDDQFFPCFSCKSRGLKQLSYEHWLKCRNEDASKKIVATEIFSIWH